MCGRRVGAIHEGGDGGKRRFTWEQDHIDADARGNATGRAAPSRGRLAGLNARRHHLDRLVAVRRDPDILQADPRWGYDSGVGRLSESPLVAVVVVLGTYTDY